LRILEIHTVPIWEEPDGSLSLGFEERNPHPPVVGWSNAALIVVNGEARWFLLTLDVE
jgi:hypothetical protein